MLMRLMVDFDRTFGPLADALAEASRFGLEDAFPVCLPPFNLVDSLPERNDLGIFPENVTKFPDKGGRTSGPRAKRYRL